MKCPPPILVNTCFKPAIKGGNSPALQKNCSYLATNCGKIWQNAANCGELWQIAANSGKLAIIGGATKEFQRRNWFAPRKNCSDLATKWGKLWQNASNCGKLWQNVANCG
jgi:hypothetical protein